MVFVFIQLAFLVDIILYRPIYVVAVDNISYFFYGSMGIVILLFVCLFVFVLVGSLPSMELNTGLELRTLRSNLSSEQELDTQRTPRHRWVYQFLVGIYNRPFTKIWS